MNDVGCEEEGDWVIEPQPKTVGEKSKDDGALPIFYVNMWMFLFCFVYLTKQNEGKNMKSCRLRTQITLATFVWSVYISG